MRLWILTVLAAIVAASAASSQVQYSDGLPLLKRRPFAPGGEFTPPPPPAPGWDPYAPPAPIVRGPIYSPYSMIRYDWLPVRTIEKLPTPVRPIPGAPAPLPPGPPAKTTPVPSAPADKKPLAADAPRPTMLPTER